MERGVRCLSNGDRQAEPDANGRNQRQGGDGCDLGRYQRRDQPGRPATRAPNDNRLPVLLQPDPD